MLFPHPPEDKKKKVVSVTDQWVLFHPLTSKLCSYLFFVSLVVASTYELNSEVFFAISDILDKPCSQVSSLLPAPLHAGIDVLVVRPSDPHSSVVHCGTARQRISFGAAIKQTRVHRFRT